MDPKKARQRARLRVHHLAASAKGDWKLRLAIIGGVIAFLAFARIFDRCTQ